MPGYMTSMPGNAWQCLLCLVALLSLASPQPRLQTSHLHLLPRPNTFHLLPHLLPPTAMELPARLELSVNLPFDMLRRGWMREGRQQGVVRDLATLG